MGPRLLNDAGIGWHIRNGEQILRTHAVTRTDLFSSTMSGRPWYAWEWLYDVLIAAVHSHVGLNGVVVFTAAVIALTFALALQHVLRRGASLPVAAGLLILAVGASMIHVTARPHVLSWLFAVIWFEVLDRSKESPGGMKRLFWLPFLMLFWVNLHGGFLLGLIMLSITLAGRLLEHLVASNDSDNLAKWLKSVSIAAGLTLLATFINPYGYKLYVHIGGYLSNAFLMNHINEFLSPDFHNAPARCFAILLVVTVVTLGFSREKPPITQMLFLLFAVWSGLYASRNLPVSSILLTLIVAPMLSRMLSEFADDAVIALRVRTSLSALHRFSFRMSSLDSKLHGHVWPILLILIGIWICGQGGRIGTREIVNAHFDARRFPVQAVSAIVRENIREPIFCPDLWGGYVIFALYSQVKVIADDRHDLYGEDFFKDYLKVVRVESGWDYILSGWRANYILVQTDSALAAALEEKPGWAIIYKDSTATFLQRRTR